MKKVQKLHKNTYCYKKVYQKTPYDSFLNKSFLKNKTLAVLLNKNDDYILNICKYLKKLPKNKIPIKCFKIMILMQII